MTVNSKIINVIIKNRIFIFMFSVSGIFLAGLLYVLIISFSTPVEMANDYQMTYREFDKNHDQIVRAEKEFDKRYNAKPISDYNLMPSGNHVIIELKDISGNSINNAKVTAIATRPDTSKYDIILPAFGFKNGQYISNAFDLPKFGRWQIEYKIELADGKKYIQAEYSVTNGR